MSEMQAISVSEYVDLLNELEGLDARVHLHFPLQHLHAAALAVFALRQKGLFCFPVLAPLDDHFLV